MKANTENMITEIDPLAGNSGPLVLWTMLMERTVYDKAVNALIEVSMLAGKLGYFHISIPYARVDSARNIAAAVFMNNTSHPDDTLIMLDCDHAHPPDVLPRLAMRSEGVVAALAVRRSKPHDPLWFVRGDDGKLRQPAEFEPAVYECDAVATCAIAIKRWVLEKLKAEGHPYPFRYNYKETDHGWLSSEDMYFAEICEKAGIRHHVDCSLVTPHLALTAHDLDSWERYRAEHPESSKEWEDSNDSINSS